MRKNKNNGITLISLVITIIVMLILVSVSISMAVNGGLFNYAGKSVGDTQNAIDKEKELAEGRIKIGDTWYDSIDDYLKNKPSANQGEGTGTGSTTVVHNWTRGTGENIDKFTCSHCNKTYSMGRGVFYTAEGKESTTLSAKKSGMDKYYEKKSKYPTDGNIGENGDQTISKQASLEWIVLGIEDTDKDGINETLLITTEEPVTIDGTNGVYTYGAAAYNYLPEELDRICKELYSNSTYGEARSMTIEDVNRALQFTPLGGIIYNGATSTYSTTGNFTTKLKNLPEETWNKIKTIGTYTPDGANTEAKLGEYELNGYAYMLSDDTHLTNVINDTLTEITTKEKKVIFGANKEKTYWLASRGVGVGEGSSDAYANFGPGRVNGGYANSCYRYFDSSGNVISGEFALRPVVSLKSELPVPYAD